MKNKGRWKKKISLYTYAQLVFKMDGESRYQALIKIGKPKLKKGVLEWLSYFKELERRQHDSTFNEEEINIWDNREFIKIFREYGGLTLPRKLIC